MDIRSWLCLLQKRVIMQCLVIIYIYGRDKNLWWLLFQIRTRASLLLSLCLLKYLRELKPRKIFSFSSWNIFLMLLIKLVSIYLWKISLVILWDLLSLLNALLIILIHVQSFSAMLHMLSYPFMDKGWMLEWKTASYLTTAWNHLAILMLLPKNTQTQDGKMLTQLLTFLCTIIRRCDLMLRVDFSSFENILIISFTFCFHVPSFLYTQW